MQVGPDGHYYEWVDEWARLPDDAHVRAGWAHNALVVTREGLVVGIHPSDGQVIVLEADGAIVSTFECGLVEGHGMCLVDDGADEYLWVADCGVKVVPKADAPYGYDALLPEPDGRVVEIRLRDGVVVRQLPKPSHAAYDAAPYLPTAVAVAPDGHIWVADGYGANLLHRFAPDGSHLVTLTGEESTAGRLDCPHGLLIDRRRGEGELYVADRENLRLLVFELDGTFLREVARGELARPCALATHGDLLAVAELRARVALLDLDDRIVGYIGDNGEVAETPGWPNSVVDGKVVRQLALTAGKFNSPHGIAIDSDGNLFVTEWLVGGRYTKLVPDETEG